MLHRRSLLLAVATLSFATNVLHADLILTLDDLSLPGTEVVVQDDTPAGVLTAGGLLTTHSDLNLGIPGAVSFSGPAGSWIVNTVDGISNPVLGELFLRDTNVSGSPGSIRVGLTDTDFSLPPGPKISLVSDTRSTPAFDATVDAESLFDPANGEFSGSAFAGTPAGSPLTFFAPTYSGQSLETYTSPFSLTHFATVTHLSAGLVTNVNTRISAEVVPEPTSVIGWSLMGLTMGGIFWWKRRRATS